MIKLRQKEGSLVWFLVLSFVLNVGAILGAYWLQIPRAVNLIQLTSVDINDLPPQGHPEAEQPEQPPLPEPTPPPDPEPTPPPLDQAPEFEIPAPTPTPIPSPQSRPRPPVKSPKQPVPSHSNPVTTPSGNQGLANGVNTGTAKAARVRDSFWRSLSRPIPARHERCRSPAMSPSHLLFRAAGSSPRTATVQPFWPVPRRAGSAQIGFRLQVSAAHTNYPSPFG